MYKACGEIREKDSSGLTPGREYTNTKSLMRLGMVENCCSSVSVWRLLCALACPHLSFQFSLTCLYLFAPYFHSVSQNSSYLNHFSSIFRYYVIMLAWTGMCGRYYWSWVNMTELDHTAALTLKNWISSAASKLTLSSNRESRYYSLVCYQYQ